MYEARALSFYRRNRTILDCVDFVVAPGRTVAIVGPNGAGKSTLLKLLTGELAPSSGEIRLDGKPLTAFAPQELARRRAVLPQSGSGSLARALTTVEMPQFAARFYDELSGGERQRVQLARVFAQLWASGGKSYLLLDEPTSSLDLSHQLLTLELARRHAARGAGVICVLHDLNLAAMAADEIVALKNGRVVAAGAPAAIVTDALMAELYGVTCKVGAVPEGPFVLPQSVRRQSRH